MPFLDASPEPSYYGVLPFEITVRFHQLETDNEPVMMKRVLWATDTDAALHAAKVEMVEWMGFDYMGTNCSIVKVIQLTEEPEEEDNEDEWWM